ncbi:hypothetical protein SDC9_90424 [bioreactor metagenome]|uniref:Uncharacterized protein n=1 Tax=bioreactor metagenome TaxID=1076179 RepID=A0A644ZSL7_9ZZZZ
MALSRLNLGLLWGAVRHGGRCGSRHCRRFLLCVLLLQGQDAIVFHKEGGFQNLPQAVRIFLSTHQRNKAVFPNLLGGRLRAQILRKGHHRGAQLLQAFRNPECADMLHLTAFFKEELYPVGRLQAGACKGNFSVGHALDVGELLRLRGGNRRSLALQPGQAGLQLHNQLAGLAIGGLIALELAQLGVKEGNRAEAQVKNSGPFPLGRALLPDLGEHVLQGMGKPGHSLKFHHGGSALDGMHYAENFVNLVLIESLVAFTGKQGVFQCLQQLLCFVYIYVQHGLVHVHVHPPEAFDDAGSLCQLVDGRQDAVLLKRLDNKAFGPAHDGLPHHGLLPHGGNHNDIGLGIDAQYLLERGQSVHLRHGNVHGNDIGQQRAVAFHRHLAVFRLSYYLMGALFQHILDGNSHKRSVVNNHDLCHYFKPPNDFRIR